MKHQLIVPACAGCNKIDGDICIAYENPAMKHRIFTCPLKSDKIVEGGAKAKKKVNPIKASKRRGR